MIEVPLTSGYVAIVDDEDASLLSVTWEAEVDRHKVYARRRVRQPDGRLKWMLMHRAILALPPGISVDHVNGNGLDNRRDNLRPATTTENSRNRPAQKNNTSGFKGVTRLQDRWSAQITLHGARVHLGMFNTAEEAARAYDSAAEKNYGSFAWLNFPEGGRMVEPSSACACEVHGPGSDGCEFTRADELRVQLIEAEAALDALRGRIEALAKKWEKKSETHLRTGYQAQLNACAAALRALASSERGAP